MHNFLLVIVSLFAVGFLLWAIDYAAGLLPMFTPFRTLIRFILFAAGVLYIYFSIFPALGFHIIGM